MTEDGTPAKRTRKPRVQTIDWQAVGPHQVAIVLGISGRQVANLVKSGVLPAPHGFGKYDLPACVQAWVVYNTAEKDTPKAASERLRYWRAHADVEELEAAEKAGTLIPAAHAELIVTAALTIVRTQTDGLAGRLAADLVGMTDPAGIRRLLLDEHRRIHAAAAATLAELRPPVDEPPGPRLPDADTAAAADGG